MVLHKQTTPPADAWRRNADGAGGTFVTLWKYACLVESSVSEPHGLAKFGPFVEVAVAHRLLIQRGPQVPLYRMLLDTGANTSAMHSKAIIPMGLVPNDRRNSVGIDGIPRPNSIYPVAVSLFVEVGEDLARWNIEITLSRINDPKIPALFKGILGRDFLRHFRMTYHGGNGSCDLEPLRPPDEIL